MLSKRSLGPEPLNPESWMLLLLKLMAVKLPFGLALWTKLWLRSLLLRVVISTARVVLDSRSTWHPLSSWNTSLLHMVHKNIRGYTRRDSHWVSTRAMSDMGTNPSSFCVCCSGGLLMFWFSEKTMAVGGKVAMGTRINFCSSCWSDDPFSAASSCSWVMCCLTLSWRSMGSWWTTANEHVSSTWGNV